MAWTLREHLTEPDRLGHLLYWQRLMPGEERDVIWQNDHSLLTVLAYRGPDMESADDQELMALRARVHALMMTLDAGWCLHWEECKHAAEPYAASHWRHPVAMLIDEERRQDLGAPGAQFETSYHLSLTRHIPWSLGGWTQHLLWENIPEGHATTDDVTSFREEITRIRLQLGAGVFEHIAPLRGDALSTYLANTVSERRQPYVTMPTHPYFLNYQLCDSDLQPGVTPMLGTHWLRPIVLKNEKGRPCLPETSYPGILDVLHDLGIEYKYVERWIPLTYAKAKRELGLLENAYRGKRKDWITQITEKFTGKSSDKVSLAAQHDAEEASEAMAVLEEGIAKWGYLTMTVLVSDEDFAVAEQKRETVEQALRSRGFLVSNELIDGVGAFLGMLPGDSYHNVEKPMVTSLTATDLAPLTSVWSGPTWVPHLRGPAMLVATGRGRTPFRITTHEGDVGDWFCLGPKGCLDGETYIQFHILGPDGTRVNHKGGTIETLYRRFHNLPQKTGAPQRSNEALTFVAPSMNDEGKIELNRIRAVWCTGERPCFRVTTASGHTIIATADHRFFTGDGYTRLEHLAPGDDVYIHTHQRPPRPSRRRKRGDRGTFSVKYHPYAPTKVTNGYTYHRLQRSRGIYEAHINGLTVAAYLWRLNTGQTEGMQFLAPALHIHHRDENWRNNTIENFELIEPVTHSRHHALKRNCTQLRFLTAPDPIISIEPVGIRTTYDIQMDAPYHNFVANNIVTHNSGKSLLAALLDAGWMRYDRSRVWAFDKGSSLKCLTLAMEGAWILFAPGSSQPLQPLARIDDDVERAWAEEWLADRLDELHVRVTPAVKEELWDSLEALAGFAPRHRTMSGLVGMLQNPELRKAYGLYTVDGPFGFFDGDEDWLQLTHWTCFEMEKLLDDFPRLVPAVFSLLARRIERALDGCPTMIPIDECHAYFGIETIAKRQLSWLKTFRRRNATLGFLTQNPLDIKNNPVGDELVQACPTRFFLPNPHALEPDTMAIYTGFGLSPRQCELIAHGRPKRDVYYVGQQGTRQFQLDVGPIGLSYCGRSRQQDLARITEIEAARGTEPFSVAWLRSEGLHDIAGLLGDAYNTKSAEPLQDWDMPVNVNRLVMNHGT